MTERSDGKPNITEPAAKAAAERELRLAAALRENLHRRKLQNRARAADQPASTDEDPGIDAAAIPANRGRPAGDDGGAA